MDCECYIGCNYCRGVIPFSKLQCIQLQYHGHKKAHMTLLGTDGDLSIELYPITYEDYKKTKDCFDEYKIRTSRQSSLED